MEKDTLYVGLDTDKRWVDVAVAEGSGGGEVRYVGKVANEAVRVERVIRRLGKGGRRLSVCYEAGPCGYGLHRRLSSMAGVTCMVVAPSKTPRRPGVRVKTNRRDSEMLAKLLRAGELTAVWVPDAAHEAMRDLVRARGAAVSDLLRCRQRIGGFLLRQEIAHVGKAWTKKHRVWLGGLVFEARAQAVMFAEMLGALDEAQARRDRLGEHVRELVESWSLAWLVAALQVLRGYGLVNAATLVAEIGDPRRFESPRQLMGYLGLVPSEDSTGERRRQGGLTKTGNGRARRALIEAAWTYTRPARRPAPSHPSATVRAIAEKARHRLSMRYRRLLARGKRAPVAISAVARESLGFIWAIAQAAAEAQPTKTQATKTQATKTQPTKTQPTKTQPTKTQATKTQATKAGRQGAAHGPRAT